MGDYRATLVSNSSKESFEDNNCYLLSYSAGTHIKAVLDRGWIFGTTGPRNFRRGYKPLVRTLHNGASDSIRNTAVLMIYNNQAIMSVFGTE